jgi:hypothetical protein
MAQMVDRSVEARARRVADVFLSHSSRDKTFVRQLAEDLRFLEVDSWLDVWELQVGDSLYDTLSAAIERSRFVGVVLGDNYGDSTWSRDELKQALSRERRVGAGIVLPLLCGSLRLPAFLEDRVYLDFRGEQYFPGLCRLAGLVHNVTRQSLEESLDDIRPKTIQDCIRVLRYCGVEPWVVIGADDFEHIKRAGGQLRGGERVRFSPRRVAEAVGVPERLRRFMLRLNEIWSDD